MVALAVALSPVAACAPVADNAAKADVDRRLKLIAPSGQSFPAPPAAQPLPLAVGQWVQYKMIDERGQPAFFTMKVVDELQGAYSIEYVTEDYAGKNVTRMDLYLGDRTNPAAMDIRGVKEMDAQGNVKEVPAQAVGAQRARWQGLLDMVTVRWQGLPQEEASVPAGRFAGCYRAETQAAFGPWKTRSRSWSHGLVPVSGLVRSQGIDKPTTLELIAFGEKGGGASEIP